MIEQRTNEWLLQRVGNATASRFRDVLTEPKTKAAKEAGEWSQTATTYAVQLVTERIMGFPCDGFRSNATDWGNEHEEEAYGAAHHALERVLQKDVTLTPGKFIPHPTIERIGGSGDGFIGTTGLLELKCPYNPSVHVRTLLWGMPDHHAQIQGNLWISGREWYCFGSYDPRNPLQPLYTHIAERDDRYIEKLEERVVKFLAYVAELEKTLRDKSEAF